MKLHKSVTAERVMEGAQASMFGCEDPGICVECGADQSPVEPDARGYKCEGCGKRAVYGCEELLLEVVS